MLFRSSVQNADQLAEREVYSNVLQIVLMGLDDAQRLAVSLAACPAPASRRLSTKFCTKQRADVAKHARVGGRVGAWRAANRRLVDADDLIDPLHALDLLTLAGAVQVQCQGRTLRSLRRRRHSDD